MHLEFHDGTNAPALRETIIENAVIAGWTGRDAQAVEKHIRELEALGVKRPASTPIFYRVSAARLTTADKIEVLGAQSSGEAEFVLLQAHGKLWVGTGSDHTDREVEAYNVSVSKQICDKPVTRVFWAYENVAAHWDDLILRSYVIEGGVERLYQEGAVSAMLHPLDLIQRYSSVGTLPEGTIMFCGTLPVIGAFAIAAERFTFELEDRASGCATRGSYAVVSLANMG
nr:MAG: DUF2848 domain-containing protein [Hyphomicrobiales bacterium]